VAFILETPQDTPEADLQNLAAARELFTIPPGSAGL